MNSFNTSNQQQFSQINPEQFKASVCNISDNLLQQLVQQARSKGVPEESIQEGIAFIKQLSNNSKESNKFLGGNNYDRRNVSS